MADIIDSMHGEPNSTRLILHRNRYNEMGLLVGMEAIKELASEDAVEVRHGHWIFKTDRRVVDGYDWQCDQCKSWQRYTSNFCPNCGARMDGEA